MKQKEVKVMMILMGFGDKTAVCLIRVKSPSECHREETEQLGKTEEITELQKDI